MNPFWKHSMGLFRAGVGSTRKFINRPSFQKNLRDVMGGSDLNIKYIVTGMTGCSMIAVWKTRHFDSDDAFACIAASAAVGGIGGPYAVFIASAYALVHTGRKHS